MLGFTGRQDHICRGFQQQSGNAVKSERIGRVRNIIARYGVLLSLIVLLFDCTPTLAAELKNPQLSPTWGEAGSSFTFKVTYLGAPPSYVRVFINGRPYDMAPTGLMDDGSPIFQYVWTASENLGALSHYFEADENGIPIRIPPSDKGNFFGPQIIEQLPQQNYLYLFQVKDGSIIWEHDSGSTWIEDVAISRNGRTIAVRDSQGLVQTFSAGDSKPRTEYMAQSGAGDIAVSDDGQLIAAACSDRLLLFKAGDDKPVWTYQATGGEYASVCMSRDGHRIIAGGANRRVDYFIPNSPKPRTTYRVKSIAGASTLALDPAGDVAAIATGCPECEVLLIRPETKEQISRWNVSTDASAAELAVSSGGKYLAAVIDAGYSSLGPRIFVYERGIAKPMIKYQAHGPYRALGASDDLQVIAAGGADGQLICFIGLENKPAWTRSFNGSVGAVAVTRDGRYVAAGFMDRRVICYEAATGNEMWSYQSANYVGNVAFSPDGKMLAVANGASHYLGMGIHELSQRQNQPVVASSETSKKQSSATTKTRIGTPEALVIAGVLLVLLVFTWWVTKRFVIPMRDLDH